MPQTPPSVASATAFQRSWVLQYLASANPGIGVTQCVLRYPRPLGVETLSKRLAEVVRAYPALRVKFDLTDTLNPRPIIQPDTSSAFDSVIRLSEATDDSVLSADRTQGLDLSQSPLFRVTLVRPNQPGEWLLLTVHSALLDFSSIRRLGHWLATGDRIGLIESGSDNDGKRCSSNTGTLPPEQLAGFWKARLDRWSPTLAIQDSAQHPHRPLKVVSSPLSESVLRGLEPSVGQHRVPPEVTVAVAWGLFLAALARTEAPAFGMWVEPDQNSRDRPLAMGGNLVPLRLEVPPAASAANLLADASSNYEETRLHAESSIHELANWAGLRHGEFLFDCAVRCDRSRTPLAPTTVTMIEQPGIPLLGTAYLGAGTLELAYAPELVSEPFARAWLSLWHQTLAGIVVEPSRPVGQLSLVPSEARAEIIERWNHSEQHGPVEQVVTDLIEPILKSAASELAVLSPDGSWSYRELDQWSGSLARALNRAGIGVDDRVAICLERGKFLPATVLGILRSGAAYVPVDPHYPSERIQLMLGVAEPRAIVTHSALRQRLGDFGGLVLCVDHGLPPNGHAHASAVTRARPDSLAYVIFTSGSTGTPKGVAMVQRALANLIRWQLDESASLPPGARTLQFASLSFDVSFQEIFATWAAGGTLVVVSEEDRRDPSVLWDHIESKQIARLFLPYVALQQLAEEAERRPHLSTRLQEIITAGEQLQSSPQLRALFRRLPHCRLVNQYGPSETHVATAFHLPADPDAWPRLPPIGRAITNSKVLVLDSQRRLLPVGVPGEIFLGGACLARGYLNRPEQTAERFESIHGDGARPQRYYRTGDLGRWNADGQVEFLGRCDDQVKIRGHRVELAEVEVALLRHPSVRAAVVLPTGTGAARSLSAYLIADATTEPQSLRDHLRTTLPDYMIPGTYVFLNQFPLTPSGKVDRRVLPQLAAPTPRSPATTLRHPANPLESDLLQLWSDLLPGISVGLADNFFDLGGTSLLAVRLQHRLEASLGRRVPIVTLFQNPTIQSLARALQTDPARTQPVNREIAERAAKQRENLARRRSVVSLRS